MTQDPTPQALSARIETLIDLLQRLLDRDTAPLEGRMDQFLEELRYIRFGMTSAAEKMEAAVDKLQGSVTVEDLQALEERLFDRFASLERELDFLCAVPDGVEDTG